VAVVSLAAPTNRWKFTCTAGIATRHPDDPGTHG
jgi:hypothetical protein